jgi:glucokinase
MNENQPIIGVDLGGTKVKAVRILGQEILQAATLKVSAQSPDPHLVIQEVIEVIQTVWQPEIQAIGVGVPSVVDPVKGIVYDVQNIPSWTEVRLKDILETTFRVPVYLNNDANCFALGEKYFGKGKGARNMIGLIVGTGMAAGLIISDRLYNGRHCGAGEFGMLPYLDHNFEYYCSGQFFQHHYDTDGQLLAQQAMTGDPTALTAFSEFGKHLGNAIMALLYALDPDLIVMGGSVSKAYPLFRESLWAQCTQSFAYKPVIADLSITVSDNDAIPVLGAAALCLEPHQ